MFFQYEPSNTYYSFFESVDEWHMQKVKIPIGTFLIDFLSLDIDLLNQKLLAINKAEDIVHYGISHKSMKDLHPLANKYLLQLIIENVTSKTYKFEREHTNIPFDSILNSTSHSFKGMQEDITHFLLTDKFESGDYADMLLSGTNSKMEIKFALYEDMSGLYTEYQVKDVFAFISLELINIQIHSIVIKQCENCKHFFIPNNRSDEIYCDRIYKDGKTCKQVGYSIKEKNDPFKHLFTTARKTQHARIRYNEHIKDYKEKHYIPWLAAAQEAKKKYQATNDIDGFRKWIENNKDAF